MKRAIKHVYGTTASFFWKNFPRLAMNAIVFGLISISVFFFQSTIINPIKPKKVIIEVYNPDPILEPGSCFEIRPKFKDKNYMLVRRVIAREDGYYIYCVVRKGELRCEDSEYNANCKFIDKYFRATKCRANIISADEVYRGLHKPKPL